MDAIQKEPAEQSSERHTLSIWRREARTMSKELAEQSKSHIEHLVDRSP